MNVLFLTLADFSSLEDRSIYTDLMKKFVDMGHSVKIVSPRERKFNEVSRIIKGENYEILKVRIGNIQKTNVLEKGISTVLLESTILNAVNKYFKDESFDLILYSTPPITLLKVMRELKLREGSYTYLMLKDIFPQNAVDLRMLSKVGFKSFIYKYFKKKENDLYSISDKIGCMSRGNMDYVHNNNNVPYSKLEVCPNALRVEEIHKLDKLSIRKEFGLNAEKKILLYGGNLGKPQGIDFFIKVLDDCIYYDYFQFVICGNGTEVDKIEKFIRENNSKDILQFECLPKKEYDRLLSSADIGLIFLDSRFTIPNIPSRMLSYMELEIPVIAATDLSTDLKDMIREGDFGWWCESRNTSDFNDILGSIISAPKEVERLGRNGRNYFVDKFSVDIPYNKILNSYRGENR